VFYVLKRPHSTGSSTPWSSVPSTPSRHNYPSYPGPPYAPVAGLPQPRPVVKGLFGAMASSQSSEPPRPAPWHPTTASKPPLSASSSSAVNTPSTQTSTVRTPSQQMTASGIPGPSLRPPTAPSSASSQASQVSLGLIRTSLCVGCQKSKTRIKFWMSRGDLTILWT
jgi:hypothetical protein